MGLLDQIANPNVPNYLDQAGRIENIKNSRQRRSMAEIGMQQKQEEDARIRQDQRQGQQAIEEATQGPFDSAAKALLSVPTDEIAETDYEGLANKLATIPGNEEAAEMYLDFSLKAKKHVLTQTKEDRDEAELLYEILGGAMKEVANLEDSKGAGAKEKYEQTMSFILNDPRFKDNEKVQQFFSGLKDYKPGLGKFIYSTTEYGKKTRDELSSKQEAIQLRADQKYNQAERRIKQGDRRLDQTDERAQAKLDKVEVKRLDGLRDIITQDDMVIQRLEGVIESVTENPNAVGLTGWAKRQLSKIAGTVGLESTEKWIETPGDIQTSARVNMITSVLIPYVTGDTSGRYSDKDMERVDELNEGKGLLTTPYRVVETTNELISIIKRGNHNARQLLDDQNYDVNKSSATVKTETGQLDKKSKYSDLWDNP